MPPKTVVPAQDPKAKGKKDDKTASGNIENSKFKIILEPELAEAPKAVTRTGYGIFEYKNGTVYEGQWLEVSGVKYKHGEGYVVHSSSSINYITREEYKGSWHEDKMHGFGIYKYISGAVYTGDWKYNKHDGKGTYEFADGTVYSGEWKNHRMHGEGTFTDKDNEKWTGEFVDGVYQSKI